MEQRIIYFMRNYEFIQKKLDEISKYLISKELKDSTATNKEFEEELEKI